MSNKSLTLTDLKEALAPIMKLIEKNQTLTEQLTESQNNVLSELNKIGSKFDVFNIKLDNSKQQNSKPTRGKKAIKTMIEEVGEDEEDKKSEKSERKTKKSEKKSDKEEVKIATLFNYFKKIYNKDIPEYKNIITEELSQKIDEENKKSYLDENDELLTGVKLASKKISIYYKYIGENANLKKKLNTVYEEYKLNPSDIINKINSLPNVKKSKTTKSKTTKKANVKVSDLNDGENDEEENDNDGISETKINKKSKSSDASEKSTKSTKSKSSDASEKSAKSKSSNKKNKEDEDEEDEQQIEEDEDNSDLIYEEF
jgi:hypothetical protein